MAGRSGRAGVLRGDAADAVEQGGGKACGECFLILPVSGSVSAGGMVVVQNGSCNVSRSSLAQVAVVILRTPSVVVTCGLALSSSPPRWKRKYV